MYQPARKLDPRVRLQWWVEAGVWAVAAVVASFAAGPDFGIARPVLLVVAAAVTVAAGLVPQLRYRRWRYEIRPRDLLLARGALFHVTTLIPFDRIQYVETHQGPLDRVFGLTRLVVYTAAGRAGQIPGLVSAEAEPLREELSRVAGVQTV